MANIKLLVPKILKLEGGYVNDIADAGGPTNMGVTLGTWEQLGHDITGDGVIDEEDIKALTPDDFEIILKIGYWDHWRADQIINQSVAEILVDWVWASGVWGIKIPQRIFGVTEDGVVGTITITKLNSYPQQDLHTKVVQARLDFIDEIIAKSIAKKTSELGRQLTDKELLKLTNKRFENGWKSRVLAYKFIP